MQQRSVNLTEHFADFIDRNVQSGRFSDESEIVREGLRLLELREREDEAKIEWLRSATTDAVRAIDEGEGLRFSAADELGEYLTRLDEKQAEAVKAPAR